MSKFEKNLLERMDAEKDNAAIAKRAFRKATNIVTQQISALEVKRVDLEILMEEKQEALYAVTYCENFTISKYDSAKTELANVEEELEDVEKTLEARKALLEHWA